jgi:hypothetical protein
MCANFVVKEVNENETCVSKPPYARNKRMGSGQLRIR